MSSGMPTLAEALVQIRAIKTYISVMFAILIWDSLATLPAEYRYVWKARWTPLKCLYLINRYWTILSLSLWMWMLHGTVDPVACQRWLARLQPGGTVVTLVACALILAIRTWALYSHSTAMLFFLSGCLMLELVVLSFATTKFMALPPIPQLELTGCIALPQGGDDALGFLITFWSIPLAFDTVILILTVYKCYDFHVRLGKTPIVQRLLKDGAFYYSCILVVDLLNVFFYLQPNPILRTVNATAAVVITSVMASRVVLSLHSLKATESTLGSSGGSPAGFRARPQITLTLANGTTTTSVTPRSSNAAAGNAAYHHHHQHVGNAARYSTPAVLARTRRARTNSLDLVDPRRRFSLPHFAAPLSSIAPLDDPLSGGGGGAGAAGPTSGGAGNVPLSPPAGGDSATVRSLRARASSDDLDRHAFARTFPIAEHELRGRDELGHDGGGGVRVVHETDSIVVVDTSGAVDDRSLGSTSTLDEEKTGTAM